MHKLQSKQLLLSATAMLPTIAAAQQQAERPNIMLIVVDDMGYSDLGCYGGEINTPNIDGLAENGIRFTQFFNSARSCPSRGSLLTGMYAQQCGITAMGVSLNTQCVTIPEALKTAGYRTAMSGKCKERPALAEMRMVYATISIHSRSFITRIPSIPMLSPTIFTLPTSSHKKPSTCLMD